MDKQTASIDLAQLDTDKLLERVNRLADWMQPIGKGSAEDLRMLIALARPVGAAAKSEQAPEHETIVREGGNLVCAACGTTAEIAAVGFDSNMQKVDIATAAGAGSAQPRAEGDERALYVKPWEQKVTERTGVERPCYRDWPNAVLDELLALRAALARAPLPAQSQPAIEVSEHGVRLPDGSFITPEGDVTGPLAEAIGEKIRAAMRANDSAAEGEPK